jgi:hypothetical protein
MLRLLNSTTFVSSASFQAYASHSFIMIATPVQRYAPIILYLILFHSSPSFAADKIGLPHEVFNVTNAIGVPEATAVTVTESVTVNYTAIESLTATQQCPTTSSTRTIHSIVFPSPDAAPIEVTSQSQVLTSFVPQMTWCVAAPLAVLPLTTAPYLNGSTAFTTFISGTDSCETVYAPVVTTICATTLTGLASKVTITACNQEVTFSSECGFELETPTPITSNASLITPAPTIKRSFTYWLAPWQSLTVGETPSDVDVKICTELDDGNLDCSRYQEVWEVVMVTKTVTITRPISFTATVSGPGTLIVATMHSVLTDITEVISLSTTLLLETEIETEVTSTEKKSPESTLQSTSTRFVTKTVVHKHTRYEASTFQICVILVDL